MTIHPSTVRARLVPALAAVVALALGLAACSISTEGSPHPITRETTVAPPVTAAP